MIKSSLLQLQTTLAIIFNISLFSSGSRTFTVVIFQYLTLQYISIFVYYYANFLDIQVLVKTEMIIDKLIYISINSIYAINRGFVLIPPPEPTVNRLLDW